MDTNINPVEEFIHSVTYSMKEQEQFAELSGDFNPIHINHGIARRELLGEIVAHGIHLVLEALNIFSKYSATDSPICITSIKVKFFNPAFISKVLKFNISKLQKNLKVEIRDDKGLLMTAMVIEVGLMPAIDHGSLISESFSRINADNNSLTSISGLSGKSELFLDETLLNTLFPSLLKNFSAVQAAELLAMTRIVGMKCPGLRSLFSGIDLKFEQNPTGFLDYEVTKVIEKFSIVTIQVTGPTLYGELLTLFRPLISRQPSIKQLVSEVAPGCFQNMRALIIGGSRGIGETTAKLIAAGGGKPIITYHTGKDEAEEVCAEIQKEGFACSCRQMSIDDLGEFLDIFTENNINAVFYYPSPKILGSNVFDLDLFRKFCFYYVEQFSVLMKLIKFRPSCKIVIFYPSTVALDEKTPGMTEYIMAKGAGEYLCHTLNRESKDISIYIERLPRLHTDQTLNLQNYPAQPVSEVMLPILLEINTSIS